MSRASSETIKKFDTNLYRQRTANKRMTGNFLTNQMLDDELMTVGVASSTRKRHVGVEFVIWKRGSTWFWFLARPNGKSGSIGATTNPARAMRKACWSIEAILQTAEPDPGKGTYHREKTECSARRQ